MSTATPTPKKKGPPQIVRLDKALKLAEQWVNNMTAVEDDPTSAESEGRPRRLGLGAKVSRQSKFHPSNDPVGRKLQAKLDYRKRKAAKCTEESTPSARDECLGDDDAEDEDLESRSSVFARKRAERLTSSLQANNKKQEK